MKMRVYTNDGEQKDLEGATLDSIEEQITELITGCDFAVGVERVCVLTDDEDDDEGEEYTVSWDDEGEEYTVTWKAILTPAD